MSHRLAALQAEQGPVAEDEPVPDALYPSDCPPTVLLAGHRRLGPMRYILWL